MVEQFGGVCVLANVATSSLSAHVFVKRIASIVSIIVCIGALEVPYLNAPK